MSVNKLISTILERDRSPNWHFKQLKGNFAAAKNAYSSGRVAAGSHRTVIFHVHLRALRRALERGAVSPRLSESIERGKRAAAVLREMREAAESRRPATAGK